MHFKILNMKVMKKGLISAALLLLAVVLFSSCEKNCLCKTTRVTATTNESRTDDMGKMSEKKCLEYNGTINDGEGVVRTIDCHLD